MKKTISSLLFLATVCFAAPNPPTAEDPMISITPVTRSMEQTGGSAAINTSGSGTWRASTSANWILLTSSSGTAGYPVGYTVGANNGVEARVGYVYVSGYVHTITQAGLGATLDSYSAAFESEGGSGSVRVNAPSGKAWHAQSNADWIAVSTESGTGSSPCAFTVAAYDEVSTRSGTLTIADNTFTVFQTGRRMKLGSAGATTDYFAGTVKIRVNALADTAWTVSVDADWLTVTDAGSGLGGDEVKVAVAENPSYNTRTGTVTIGTETFAVTQLGRTALVFRIAPTEVGTFGVDGAAGERLAVTATPDLGWTVAASADWIELYEGYDSGSGSGSVVYKVKPNPTLSPRSGSITVTAADGAVAAKRLDIAQEAAVASLTVAEYEFEAAGESLAVGVNTGSIVEWGVTNLPAWLSVSSASSTGPAGITLTAAANTSVQPRSATIRIADHEFRVSQKGRGVTVAYEPHVFDADGKATGENADNPITVTADADVTWTAVASDDTWIIVYEGRTGQGNGTVRFIVAPYVGDGEVRTGLITIGSEIVYVTQRPYDISIDPIGARVDGNAGAGEIQVALDIDGVWNAIATEPWISIVSGYDAGTGNGKVLFSYTDNNTGRQRTGKIIVAGETYTLTQAARQLVAIAASAGGRSGTVTGGGTYERDSEIALEAVPEAGYAFDHWILPGGGTSTENPLSVTVTAAGSYQAFFSPLAPRLSVSSASLRGVALKWTDLPWATELRVFRGTSSNRAQATKIATVANDGSCAYLDATGTENLAYWYWVEAVGVEDDVWSEGVQGKREKATFSIDYTNLRGTTHANPATYREGTAVSFSAPSSRTGFTFLGWTPSGITADTSGDVTARANWAQNEYTVRFDLAGAAGSMADETFTYGLWKYLSPTNFSRPGYTFLGWAVKPTSTAAIYDDFESVKSLTTERDGIVTLYALWRRDGLDDPLPDLGASASSSDIVAVLVGCVDAGNLGENIASAAEYADFRAWADAVRDGSGAAAGHTGVRDSPHAWLSYALGQGTLLESAPEPGDLVILDFAASESDPSRFDLLFGLDGIVVGDSAKPANLAKTFAIEGAESLSDEFSANAVTLLSIGPSEGAIASSVEPVSDADSFFFRVVDRSARATTMHLAYLVIDLAGGANASSYPVTYLAEPPEGGFNTDEYKTTKLALRRLEPGPVPTHDATLTKPFYVGLYEVTQKQWELVMGTRPSYFSNDSDFAMRPVEQVSYDMIRGSSLGAQWPASNAVDSDSFLGALRARTGLDFDLPTEAQWEYACRAGTTTTYGYGDSANGDYMWYGDNSSRQTHAVGEKLPNAWGLYDMHGNVWEWCLDWDGSSLSGNDPVGSSSGSYRVLRGGGWYSYADYCSSSYRFNDYPSYSYDNDGFRLVRTLTEEYTNMVYTLTFDSAGGSEVAPIAAAYGATLTAPTPPTKDGYDFAGWSPAFPTTMPLGGATLTALWTADADYFTWTASEDAATITGVNQTPSGALDIPSEIDGIPVKGIGTSAFHDCTGLTSVVIPGSVTNIGSSAFSGCTGLTSVVISENVAAIGAAAFSGCSGLTSVVIPGSVKLIGISAFQDCSGLTSIMISPGVKSIGWTAFYKCTGLTTVAIPETVTEIGSHAFFGCSGLTTVAIPAGVATIGQNAFSGCSGLTSFSVDGDNPSFSEESGLLLSKDRGTLVAVPGGLEHVTIPETVSQIGVSAFSRCSGLTTIAIPAGVATIERGAFSHCSGLTSFFVDNDNLSFSEESGLLLSKDRVTLVAVPGGLEHVTIPSGVANVGDYAFSGCSRLVSVSFPDSLTNIGNSAFSGCSGLVSVSFPDSLTNIGNYAFDGCSGLVSVSFPDSLTNIGNYAFDGCSGLVSVSFPDSLTSIGHYAFSNCSGLTSFSVDGDNPYFSAESGLLLSKDRGTLVAVPGGLVHVTIPSGVASVGDCAFQGCSSLVSVSFPDSLTNIGNYAFSRCSSLVSVSFPDSLTNIGNSAFSGCSGLISVSFPDGLTNIGTYAFDGCSGLVSVSFPGSLRSIGYYAFRFCSSLVEMTIPDGVTSIGSGVFSGCSGLTSLSLPGRFRDNTGNMGIPDGCTVTFRD